MISVNHIHEEIYLNKLQQILPANCLASSNHHSTEEQLPVGGGQAHAQQSQREDQGAAAEYLEVALAQDHEILSVNSPVFERPCLPACLTWWPEPLPRLRKWPRRRDLLVPGNRK